MDIAQSILEAIDTVVSQRLTQLQFDNTIICTIVDNTNRALGEYTVSFQGNTQFYAYSDYKEYPKELNVYVLVPGGDWNARKQILGRISSNDINDSIAYIDPATTIAEYGPDGHGDTAIISAEFTSQLDEEIDLNNSLYGYSLEIPVEYVSDTETQASTVHLTSANILGNPWDLPVPQKISARVKAPSGYKVVVSPVDKWYLLCNHPKAVVTAEESLRSISYGFDLSTRENETVEIATTDPLVIPLGTAVYTATLSAFWINKNDNNTYKGFEEGFIKDKKNAQVLLSTERENKDAIYYWISWYSKVNDGEWKEVSTEFSEKYEWTTDNIQQKTTFQAHIYKNGRKFISNELSFISAESIEAEQNPPLFVSIEGDKDYFNHYGLDGETREIGPYQYKIKYSGWSEERMNQFNLANKHIEWSIKTKDKNLSMIESIDEDGKILLKPSYKITTDENNTIVAKVTIAGKTYTAEKVLRFSTLEQSGNGYYIHVIRPNTYYDFEFNSPAAELEYILYKDAKNVQSEKIILAETEYESLQVAIETKVDSTVVAKKIVPLAIGSADYRYEGPVSILYDSFGSKLNNQSRKMYLYYQGSKIENVEFRFFNSNANGWQIKDNYLVPPDLFIETKPIIIEARVDNIPVWRQGIVVFQNRYSSQFINDWDGSLTIDKNGKSIMSAMIGAGKKDILGRFTGVFMGDVTRVSDGNTVASGLLGYTEGVQTFGFNTDGTAFIKSASGTRGIYLNANPKSDKKDYYFSITNGSVNNPKHFKVDQDLNVEISGGIIQSPTSTAMKINIDDGIIEAQNGLFFNNNLNSISIETNGVKIAGNAKVLFSIDKTESAVSLCSFDYMADIRELTTSDEGDSLTSQFTWIKRTLLRNLPSGINIRAAGTSTGKILTTTDYYKRWIDQDTLIAFYFPVSNSVNTNVNNNSEYYPIYIDDANKPFLTDNAIKAYIQTNKKYPNIGYIWRYGGSASNPLFKTNIPVTAPEKNERVNYIPFDPSSSPTGATVTQHYGSIIELNQDEHSYILLRGPNATYLKIGGDPKYAIAIYKDRALTTPAYTVEWPQ